MQGGRDSGERGGAEEDSNPLTLLAVIIKEQKKGLNMALSGLLGAAVIFFLFR